MNKSILPVTLAFSLVITCLLVIMCILGVTQYTASEKLKQAEQKIQYTTDYYTAETRAAELLSTHSDGSAFFSVPINNEKELEVVAEISQGKINVLKWNTEIY
jgi:hypothetical protein